MTVKYNIVPHGNPSDPTAPTKYYAAPKASGTLTLRELANLIARISTISQADTFAVLEALLQVVPQALGEGNVVQLGDLGSFWLRFKSAGQPTPEDVSADQINNVLVRFNPGKELKRSLRHLQFEKYPTK